MSIILVSLSLHNHVFSFLIFFLNLFLKIILGTNLVICWLIWDRNCKTVFPKLELIISILILILSKNMCKLRRKLRNVKIYLLVVQILQIIFFMSFYGQFSQLFNICEPTLSKQFFSELKFLFSVLGSMVSKKTSVNWVTNWKMPKNYPNSLGHEKINLDITKYKPVPLGTKSLILPMTTTYPNTSRDH